MRALLLSLALCSAALLSVVAWAYSGDTIWQLEVQNQSDGQVKVCINDYDTDKPLICSAATAKGDKAIEEILRIKTLAGNPKLDVGFGEGFFATQLRDAMAVKNCHMSEAGMTAINQKLAQIQQLKEDIRSIEATANYRSCK